jgi:berberine-like enzyme
VPFNERQRRRFPVVRRADARSAKCNFWSALEPHFTTVYVNFLMDEGEDRVRQAYRAEKYDRLKTLKRKYDPDNFFRINQNIPPA